MMLRPLAAFESGYPAFFGLQVAPFELAVCMLTAAMLSINVPPLLRVGEVGPAAQLLAYISYLLAISYANAFHRQNYVRYRTVSMGLRRHGGLAGRLSG